MGLWQVNKNIHLAFQEFYCNLYKSAIEVLLAGETPGADTNSIEFYKSFQDISAPLPTMLYNHYAICYHFPNSSLKSQQFFIRAVALSSPALPSSGKTIKLGFQICAHTVCCCHGSIKAAHHASTPVWFVNTETSQQ